jgi:two-component system, OmpR family, sensor histidine kinase KdpD
MSAQVHPRGRLKMFLGAAAGVGKSYAMLGEARDLKAAGVDVVIGYLEPHGRRATEDRAAGLEVAPRRIARVQGRPFAEMDADWLLERMPQLCLVDELAHTNHPGGRHAKRWRDVEELLDAGIDVFTTVNIQHLESLNDKIHEITGVRVRETFPDRLLHEADEVVLVDLPPDALRERIAQGRVYPPEKVRAALTNFFRIDNLIALRSLALREVAEQEERQLLGPELAPDEPPPALGERVMVCIDGRPDSSELVRRAARMARRASGRLYVLHVEPEDEQEPASVHEAVEAAERLGLQLGATVVHRAGDVAETVVKAARELAITQIVLGESHRPRWKELIGQSIIARILRETDGVDVHIIADKRTKATKEVGSRGPQVHRDRR